MPDLLKHFHLKTRGAYRKLGFVTGNIIVVGKHSFYGFIVISFFKIILRSFYRTKAGDVTPRERKSEQFPPRLKKSFS